MPFAALSAGLLLLISIAATKPAHASGGPRFTLMDGEAKENAGSVTAIARLDRPARWPVIASLRISGGDAQAGVDYLAPAPNLVLMPGEADA